MGKYAGISMWPNITTGVPEGRRKKAREMAA
jgi:hypothetical protein